ncbi:MAG TPA: class I SAM-dependent methyltransferase [Pyrinomonadaceae bacterium]|jgi:Methylase involved in ubiquinone/menaquinone biosynthesis|nr:class I SAM-dependent methyltransferase [Pyrinomonadaceae bacterium]
MASHLEEWEKAERERSAYEASHTQFSDSLASPKNVARYFAPPSDTVHPLEYAFNLLGDVRGKTILEYGCGDGVNTVLLANRGAKVISLDLSPELIDVARQRLQAHDITSGVDLIVGSAHNVPLPNESVDVVFGIAILHHLDLELSAKEVRRLLKKDGIAIFQEPVRNSWVLRQARKMIPYQSPDVSPFERPLTDKELRDFAADYSSYHSKGFTLPTSALLNVLPGINRYTAGRSLFWDSSLLKRFPFLDYYAPVKVIQMTK